jgi:PQQ-dependent dehydrogenase (methanol/ethanol family)
MHCRTTQILLFAALFATGCNRAHETAVQAASATAPSPAKIPGAVANIHLTSPLPDHDYTLPAGDYGHTRFSPIDQINIGNAKNLRVSTTLSTGVNHGHEGSPLVVNGTLYIITPYPNNLIAVDLSKPGGQVKWIFQPNPDPRSMGIACCDVVNRGGSYADGKIVYNLLDAHTVAVDAQTGKQVWRTQVGDINYGETTTMAPLVVKDKVYVGNAGGELGVRGKLTCLDLKTGKELWRAYSTGPDADVRLGQDFKPWYAKDQGKDLGVTSWTPGQWKLGGGSIWGWVSYDPELNLIFYGTGNPGVWSPDMRPGDNKWSLTIFARDPDSGYAKWAFQVTAHDAWDYDEIMENIVVDMDWQGRPRKLLLHPGRNGFLLVLDRETGELLSAQSFQPSTNWASGYDLRTGKPQEDPAKRTHLGKVVEDICPSSTGAKEFVPSSLSPRTGLLYIPAHNTCMDYKGMEANYIAGTPYLGADVKMFPGPGGYQGELEAWDFRTGKKVWGLKDDKFPVYSGVLSTAGDLVFYGTMEGWFRAVNARTGDLLWQFKTGSGIIGNPMTYIGPDGKQYVAVYSGIGGWMGAAAFASVSSDDNTAALGITGAMKGIKEYSAAGDTLYVFSL